MEPNELANFLTEKFGNNIQIVSPPYQRTKPREIEWVPETKEQFYEIVNNAPWHILKALGFRRWERMNNLIKENQEMPTSHKVEMPIINSDEKMTAKFGKEKNYPTEILKEDEDVILFPGEWFDIIPDGFECTGLYGEPNIFYKALADDDIRFGCIPYGIRRKCEPKNSA